MQNANHQSRRAFLCNSGGLVTASTLGLSGAQTGAAQAAANADPSRQQIATLTDGHFYLSDVRLEEGFEREGDVIVGTRTGIRTLEIQNGRIKAVHGADATLNAALPRYKAQGKLLLPAFRDMHIHLDKTFYGGPWQAPLPRQGKTIMDMIAREEVLLRSCFRPRRRVRRS